MVGQVSGADGRLPIRSRCGRVYDEFHLFIRISFLNNREQRLFHRVLGDAPSFPPPDELAAWRAAKAEDGWSNQKRLMMAM